MNYFRTIWYRIRTFFSSPSKRIIFIVVVAVLAVGVSMGYRYWPRQEGESGTKKVEARSNYPVFSVFQSNKFRVMYHDYDKERTYELFSMDEKAENKFYLYADYSNTKNQIVYSNSEGIFVYDLAAAKSTKVLGSERPKNETATKIYFAPKWSPDGSKIAYRIGYYEGASYGIMNADGSGAQAISQTGYVFAWNSKSDSYVIGSSAGMSEGGLYVSQTPLHKVREIVAGDTDADSPVWIDNETIVVSLGKATSDKPEKKYLATIKSNGEGLTVLEKDDNDNNYPVIGTGGTIYFAKYSQSANEGRGTGKGVYTTNLTDKKSTSYYVDGDKLLFPESISRDHLLVRSPNTLSNEAALTKYSLFSLKDKKVLEFAEANKISSAGWLNSSKVPNGVKQSEAIVPTDAEKEAYSDSLKSRGYLYNTYYDFCWDYDCSSGVFPYSKKSKSFSPDIVEITRPIALTGTVEVPVVYAYDKDPFTSEYTDIFKDPAVKNSFGYLATWLNDQAKSANQTLNYKFSYQSTNVKIDHANCLKDQGNYKRLDNTCFRDQILKEIPALKSNKLLFVVIARDSNTSNYGLDTSYVDQNGTSMVIGSEYPNGYLTGDKLKERFETSTYFAYTYRYLLQAFGAKLKIANYGKPAAGSLAACVLEPGNDLMCGQVYKDASRTNMTVYRLDETTIGEITRKELGWFDADGDKTNEVDDKCPYNKANNCKK